ncbi:TPA: transposase [Escherichia coli]|nr:transposase [Escherichia coli]QVT89203.1 transposase [Escherichia coli]HAN9396356.1 transposase [Escherichia coli]HAX3358276.1 transposase [Escherichia coli]HAY0357981.1 transposase [Escherichia coli]
MQKKAKTGCIWIYARDDRIGCSDMPPAVWFVYSLDRKGKPLLETQHERMVENNATLSKNPDFSYVLNQRGALCYYSDGGLAEADNNTAERALRTVCLSKKKFLWPLSNIKPKKTLRSSGSFVISRIKEPETVRLYLGFYKLLFGDFSPMTIYAVSWPLSTCRY